MTWATATLGDICQFKYGRSLPADRRRPGPASVYGSNGRVGSHAEALLEGPAIIIGRKGSFGEVHFSEGPIWPIDTTYYIDKNSANADLSWLKYLLRSLPLKTLNKSAAIPGLNREDAYRLSIRLPPLSEQRRIAAILDKADALRRKRQRALELLDGLDESIFRDMFGNPSRNARGWEMRQLGDLVINEDYKRVPIKSSDRDQRHGQYPYYGASGIIDYIDEYIFEGRRLLIAEDGANLLSRSTPIAFFAEGKYWVNNHAHVIAESSELSLVYLRAFLQAIDLSPYVTGSAQPKLNRANLDAIQVPLPPLALQREFELRVKRAEHLRVKKAEASSTSEALFSSLQSRAFSGQL